MKKLFILSLFLILSSCKSQEVKINIILDIASYKNEVVNKEVQLVDVRTPEEYQKGHIEHAININFFEKESFFEKFNKLDKNKKLYIYCASGNRSHKSSIKLEEMGFTKIYDLEGGITAWKAKGN